MDYPQPLLTHSTGAWAGPAPNGFFLLLLAHFPLAPWPESLRSALRLQSIELSPLCPHSRSASPLCPKTSPSLWLLCASAQDPLPVCPLTFAAATFSKVHWSRSTTCSFSIEDLQAMSCSHQFQSCLDLPVSCPGQLLTFSHAAPSDPNAALLCSYSSRAFLFHMSVYLRLHNQNIVQPVPKARQSRCHVQGSKTAHVM